MMKNLLKSAFIISACCTIFCATGCNSSANWRGLTSTRLYSTGTEKPSLWLHGFPHSMHFDRKKIAFTAIANGKQLPTKISFRDANSSKVGPNISVGIDSRKLPANTTRILIVGFVSTDNGMIKISAILEKHGNYWKLESLSTPWETQKRLSIKSPGKELENAQN